jgi:fermentation-respiration switch protein FrsA (DUF1100 family)
MRWLAVLALLIAAFFGVRFYALNKLEHSFSTHKQGPRTPATRGLVYEELPIDSEGRTLKSFYVPADGPALLIFHGNGESISGWVDALALLHKANIAAMVFDYSGFGNSPGEPTFANFHQDGLAAWHTFRVRVPGGARACAYGFSLGSGVLLDVAAELSPKPDCFVVSGAYLSLRDAAVAMHRVPKWGAWLLPDAQDSLENIGRFRGPMLIEHGELDERFPPQWAAKLAAAHEGAQTVVVPGMHHADFVVVHPDEKAWRPVIDFVKPPAAPSALSGK